MPFFNVRCNDCQEILPTPYFTSLEILEEIKIVMSKCDPLEITCRNCGLTAVYTRDDLGIVADTK